jgi:hypothetical protein
MTNEPIDRPALTKALFDHIAAVANGTLLGRGVAPPKGGWPDGKERNGAWVNYAVLKTGVATTPAPGFPERMGRHRTSWECGYQLTSHSTKESTVDDVAQQLRKHVVTWDGKVVLGGVEWELQEVGVSRLGDTQRDDSTDPAHWRVTDDVSVRLSRVLSR